MMSRRQWACRPLSRWGRSAGISSAGVHPDSRQETRCTSPPWSGQSTGRPPPPSGRCGSRCRCRRRSISRAPGTSGWGQSLLEWGRHTNLTWRSEGTRLSCPAGVDIPQFSPSWNRPGSAPSRPGRRRGSSPAGPQSATRGQLTSAGNPPDRSHRSRLSRRRYGFSPAVTSRSWDKDFSGDQSSRLITFGLLTSHPAQPGHVHVHGHVQTNYSGNWIVLVVWVPVSGH